MDQSIWTKVNVMPHQQQTHCILTNTVVHDGQKRAMETLRAMFPREKVEKNCFIVFSTGGAHGTEETIEEVEELVARGVLTHSITFLIVQPIILSFRYGTVVPRSHSDIQFLRALRDSSRQYLAKIGS